MFWNVKTYSIFLLGSRPAPLYHEKKKKASGAYRALITRKLDHLPFKIFGSKLYPICRQNISLGVCPHTFSLRARSPFKSHASIYFGRDLGLMRDLFWARAARGLGRGRARESLPPRLKNFLFHPGNYRIVRWIKFHRKFKI